MSTLDEWEMRRRPYRGPRRNTEKRVDRRAVKAQMRLFTDPPKKAPPIDNGTPFNDDIPF